jgi:hypothetical protein
VVLEQGIEGFLIAAIPSLQADGSPVLFHDEAPSK